MITITNKEIIDGYVHLTLSSGEDIAIAIDWATQYVQESYINEDGDTQWRDTDKSLLQHEIEQAPIRAQQRIDDQVANNQAAQNILDNS